MLVVWKLDRLGRNLAHLVNTVQDLSARGVGLRVLAGDGAQIDTTTAAGRLVFGIFAALAEFERELIRERTVAGLKAARARGRKGGWKFALSKAQVRLAQAAMAHRDTSVCLPRVPLAGRNLASPADPPPRREPERPAALGGSRALRGPRRLLASSRRFERRRAALVFLDTTAAGPGGESVSTAPPSARPPNLRRNHPRSSPRRTPKGLITHDLDENPLPGHPVVDVRRAPVRSEADREGRRAGELPEVPAVPVGGQLPETPGSDKGGEAGDRTGRAVTPSLGLCNRRRAAERIEHCDGDNGDGAQDFG